MPFFIIYIFWFLYLSGEACQHVMFPGKADRIFDFCFSSNSSISDLCISLIAQGETCKIVRGLDEFTHWGWDEKDAMLFCKLHVHCPACRTSLIATRFWVVVICPIIKCLTVLVFSFILFDLCLFITIFNFILNYVPIVTFWIFTYHKIWILLIIFCFIWNYLLIHFLTCLEVFWSVVS